MKEDAAAFTCDGRAGRMQTGDDEGGGPIPRSKRVIQRAIQRNGRTLRRRVFRAVAWYVVAGWVVIQVGATVLPGLQVPQWSVTLVIVLVVLGLPLAAILAWAFEIAGDRIRRTADATPAPATMPVTVPAAAAHATIAPAMS